MARQRGSNEGSDEPRALPLAPTERSTGGLRGHPGLEGATLPSSPSGSDARDALGEPGVLAAHSAPAAPAPRAQGAEPAAAELEAAIASAPEASRYQIRGELGRGGMGRVVEALDRRLGRVVALKESLAVDVDSRLRFEREVAITALLEHPSIVPLHDAGTTAEGRPFYVMRKLSGQSLDRVLLETRSLDERLALLPTLLAACDAVAHAHARHVVHRDLKPGNILVGDHGETMVIDWGLAKVLPEGLTALSSYLISRPAGAWTSGMYGDDGRSPASSIEEQLTAAGSVFGTPGFMSPEQARGQELDLRADVYALGSTLYHLLAGHALQALAANATTLGAAVAAADAPAADAPAADAPAADAPAAPALVAADAPTRSSDTARTTPPPPLARVCPGAPAELVAIVEKAMAQDLGSRYPDASALAADLRRFLAGQLVAAHRYTRRQRLRLALRAHRATFLVAGSALLLMAALAAISIRRIIIERHAAIAESRIAAVARAQAELRADDLLVARAESLIPEDPTASLALLKQLPSGSSAWPRARMAAIGAYANGVARGFPVTGARPPTLFEMSPRGDALLVAEEDGRVWLLELAELRRRELVQLDSRPLGCWLDGGEALLLASEPGGVLVYTLAGGDLRKLPVTAPAVELSCALRGGAAYRDRDGAIWRIDRATDQPRRAGEGGDAAALSISYDGAWLAIGSPREAVVLDRAGAPRYRAAGHVERIARSPGGRFGFLFEDRVVELGLPSPSAAPGDAPPVKIITRPAPQFAVEVYFVDDALMVLQVGNHLRAADSVSDVDLPSTPMASSLITDGALAIGLNDGSLWISGWWGTRVLPTSTTNPLQRVAGQPGTPRFASWSRDAILIWETSATAPRRLPTLRGIDRLSFLDENTLMLIGEGAHLVDLTTGTLRSDESVFLRTSNEPLIDPDTGDALLHEPITGRVVLLRRASGQVLTPWSKPASCAALLAGDAVILGAEDGQLALGQPGHLVLHQMAHPVVGVSRLGAHGALAIDAAGELLAFDRPDAAPRTGSLGEPSSGLVFDDDSGGAVIGMGNRLMRWRDGQMSELARFDKPPLRLTRHSHHLVVFTFDEVFIIDLAGRADRADGAARTVRVPRRVGSSALYRQLTDRSRWVIGSGQRNSLNLLDVVTGARWARPIFNGMTRLAVSPSGTHIAQLLPTGLALWTYAVPETPVELDAWLARQTNAQVDTNLDITWKTP